MKNIFDFFYYTKAERKACVLLLILCSLAFVLPEWIDFSPHYDLQSLGKAPKVLQVRANWAKPQSKGSFKGNYSPRYGEQTPKVAVFSSFDPNVVSLQSLLNMGLSPRSAHIWVKYLSKGGRFKKREDVLKIYGLPPKWYQMALPHMHIAASSQEQTEGSLESQLPKKEWTKLSAKSCIPIDINTADTASWQSLRGIGKVLANRIVKFRDKLGGFYAIDQVKETYGLVDSVYQKIQPCLQLSNPTLKPLNINQASFNELAGHPYLGFKAAKAILTWRDQHGPFTKVEDLEAIVALREQQLSRVRPYLQF